MGSSKTAATKKASARKPRAEAEAAPEVPAETSVGSAPALTAEATQPAPPLTDAGDGPAAAPVSETSPDGEQQPLPLAVATPPAASGSEVTQPEGQQPLTQPEHETGLIEPQAGVTPPGDSNQPTAETPAPNPPPSSEEEGAGEVTEVQMPPAREPDQGVIAEAATYATAPAEAGEAVATGYFLPAPPDLRTPPPKARRK